MIKVAYFSFDDLRFPSAMIRVLAPTAALAPKVALLSALTRNGEERQGNPAALDEADIVLVQRGFPRAATVQICETILASGKPVIYETDDALQHLPKGHKQAIYPKEVVRAIEQFVRRADLVTVATAPLQALYSTLGTQVALLPNYLSPELWTDDLVAQQRPSDRVRIGFVGSADHDRDLATLAPLLREAMARYENVEVVSCGGITAGLEDCPRFSCLPPDYDYARYPRRLADLNIDIAVAPLVASRFNRCKSNIKFLEFAFLGVPGIFAALEPYRASVVHGETGFLCDGAKSWREALFALIEDAGLRSRVGGAAREVVRSAWMLDRHKDEWLRAYELAIRIRSRPGRRLKQGKGVQ